MDAACAASLRRRRRWIGEVASLSQQPCSWGPALLLGWEAAPVVMAALAEQALGSELACKIRRTTPQHFHVKVLLPASADQ